MNVASDEKVNPQTGQVTKVRKDPVSAPMSSLSDSFVYILLLVTQMRWFSLDIAEYAGLSIWTLCVPCGVWCIMETSPVSMKQGAN